jgi:hypothetical protein
MAFDPGGYGIIPEGKLIGTCLAAIGTAQLLCFVRSRIAYHLRGA